VLNDKPQSPDDRLQQEFNRWGPITVKARRWSAITFDITEKTMRRMDLASGWAYSRSRLRIGVGDPTAARHGGRGPQDLGRW